MMKNTRLVFSTNPQENQTCKKCRELLSECTCQAQGEVNPADVTGIIRMEKSGRGGKQVTVIDKLPPNKDFLKALASKLKAGCGCGGSHKITDNVGRVEIQGDKRPKVRELLKKEGIAFKG